MSDKTSSTAQSYLDSTVGAVQSAIGSVTGSTGDQAEGDARQEKAKMEDEASHAVGKVGPYNVSAAGGVSKDDPRRTQGSWDQTIGAGKEMVGNALGMPGLKKEGEQQNAAGKGLEAEGQLADYGSGIKDRVTGTLGGVGAAITGDREAQQQYQLQHDDGKTAQRSAEKDISKAADA